MVTNPELASEELITRAEAARRLGCSLTRLHAYLRAGQLRRYRKGDGHFVRLRASEVEALRRQRYVWTPTTPA